MIRWAHPLTAPLGLSVLHTYTFSLRVHACDVPEKFDALRDEFADRVCLGLLMYIALGSKR